MYHPERVRDRAQAYINAKDYSSLEWHIERGGKTLSNGQVGLADVNTGTSLPKDPIYRIFSMTKPLVSAVGVMLLDEGKLRLSDPVGLHLPGFAEMQVMNADGNLAPAQNTMLVEHLFTHRSGITYQWQQGNPVAPLYLEKVKLAEQHSLAELVDSLAELPLFAEPGTRWHYSLSTDVLGHLISVIEGKPLALILKERIFDPLGMVDTAFFVPEEKRDRLLPVFGDAVLTPGVAKPKVAGDGQLHYGAPYMIYTAENPMFERGGLGLFSTVADYAKAARFLLTGTDAAENRIISKAGIRALWSNRLPASQLPISIGNLPKYYGYGYGLGGRVMVNAAQSPFYGVNGECGWEGAATTYFWLDPENDITGVVMSQYLGQKMPVCEDIRHMFYQSLV
ncbi:serine hydrolase [Sphingobium sp. DEHP117]|jgi:CubicO group peptidase (beta-lactamase class C family)|uniref:serine hydrolase domain-containing protein n=1 Tax=Sphingobium sp. DEHP117 TaxID=2993436 RepID=UPI0027D6766B|nr:serine hydrolase [Sphingobium sp. DEHP117]MDQ4422206.1 serine hydrolase [Sphingobium sp. DEHP117]MDQ4422209.1 serine hydrolase [Sphingobium sp. DEHP117]